MKTQIITALSIAAVIGAAGSAYAINQSVLGAASAEDSIIGTATPIEVPIEPKGNDIPADYLALLEQSTTTKTTPAGTVISTDTNSGTPAAAPDDNSSSAGDDDSDEYEDESEDEYEDEEESEDDD